MVDQPVVTAKAVGRNIPRVEVLLSTLLMTSKDELILRTGITGDAIIVNQCEECSHETVATKAGTARFLSLPERGTGLSRATALARAHGDICLIADDDIRLSDEYEQKILRAFEQHPRADVILFNLSAGGERRQSIKEAHRVSRLNYQRYGAPRIAFRRDSVIRERITFSPDFGPGAKFAAGEDTLFLNDCLRSGLTLVAVPETIGEILSEDSTWFQGYDRKFFLQRGALFAALEPNLSVLLTLRFLLARRSTWKGGIGLRKATQAMFAGMRKYKTGEIDE